ncbi:MAG: SIMPL domain-containing protein, partial [Phyllobacteriaceae bacterium]|nr:SIMPL domain-containing protein [Phyllobacteriaceae bacterium]
AGVVSRGRTTAEALQKADAAAGRLVADAKAAGLADADVATSSFSVSPLWSTSGSDGAPSHITGYSVENTFELKIRRLADLGPLLERLVAGGTNAVSGIAFDVSDADKRRDQARVAAVTAARARAELLADAAGERIVRVLAMTEGGDDRPMPRVFAKAAMPSAAVPIEPGSRTIVATVTMTFELAPRETK